MATPKVLHCLWALSEHTSNYSVASSPMLGCGNSGLSVTWLCSSAYSLFISKRNDRTLLLSRFYIEKGHESLPIPVSQSRISLVLGAALLLHSLPSMYGSAWVSVGGGRMQGQNEVLKLLFSL